MHATRTADEITLRINLNEQALNVIEFLKTVNDIPELNQLTTLKRAIYRYENYWLPLAATHSNKFLAPPLDVEWAWHCHMLNPHAYERDCKEIVGTIVKHTMLGARQFFKEQKRSRKYWLEKYGKHGEPFDIDYGDAHERVAVDAHPSKITYDIVAASKRQTDLYYQVSLPHYQDRKYLAASHQRYKQFLYAKGKMPNAFLEPSYDIDLFWHAHQLNPPVYKEDMMRIVGYFLNHGASIDHRTVDDRLNADKKSRETWKYLYNETMPIFGGMYRGSQPAGFLAEIGQTDMYSQCTDVMFENVTITIPRISRNITISMWSLADGKCAQHLFSLNSHNVSRLQNTMAWKNVGKHIIETTSDCRILILLETHVGDGLKTVIGSNIVDILPWLERSTNMGTCRRINTRIPLGHNIRLDLTVCFKEKKRGDAAFTIEMGKYRSASIPENHKQFLGPIGLEQYPRGVDNYCEVAIHRLRSHVKNATFSVRTIHSRSLMASVIQVFYENKMAAIAHLIGSDHLPLPSQIEKDGLSLNPLQGERAILLKNINGDWGILTGRWIGDRQERAMIDGVNGVLQLKFFKFSTGQTTTVEVKRKHGNDYMCRLESTDINLTKGILNIESDSNEVSENIALAFSVSLLHVICVPVFSGRYDARDLKAAFILQQFGSETTKKSTSFNEMSFLKAVGILQNTPSNEYMYAYKRDRICQMCSWGCPLEFEETDYRKAIDGGTANDSKFSTRRYRHF